jgi:formylglycine-generating enzyme required for sulfatase activity
VGSYPANPWGLSDMHGNLWQWCSDWYDAGYYGRGPRPDPQGPAEGEQRVIRGGCWNSDGRNMRAAVRCVLYPDGRRCDCFTGFRVALSIPPKSP